MGGLRHDDDLRGFVGICSLLWFVAMLADLVTPTRAYAGLEDGFVVVSHPRRVTPRPSSANASQLPLPSRWGVLVPGWTSVWASCATSRRMVSN